MVAWVQDAAINTLWYQTGTGVNPDTSGTAIPAFASSGASSGAVAINVADGLMWVRVTDTGSGSAGWEAVAGGGGGGSMTSFELSGDSGSNQTIADGNTLEVAGGTGITTVAGGTDTVTVSITDAGVTFAKMQDVAANSILGRNANSSGVLSEIALADRKILIGDGTGFTAAILSGDVTMLNTGAVTIGNSKVTLAKMANLAGMKIIGRGNLAAGIPEAVTLFDEDNMASDSATGLATQQSIKSYVDNNTGDITQVTITAGTGLTGTVATTTGAHTQTLALDMSELTDMTQAVTRLSDELIILDSGADRRKLISEIPLSAFNNDLAAGGDITQVTITAGTGLSGTVSTTSGAHTQTIVLDMSELTDR